MALGDPRVTYYAAGVLAWAQLQKQESFTADDPSSWRLVDGEADPYGEHGHYLPNATLLGLGLEYLVELGVLAKVVDRYGPDMYSQLNRYGALRSLAEAFPNSPFEHTNRFGERWITKALDRINLELAEDGGQIPPPPVQDTWEPLQLDLSAPEVDKAIDELSIAIKAIAADNGFAIEYPIVRDALVSDATATVDRIRAGTATRGQVWKNLVTAGRWIADKFSGSAIGAVGSELVKWALRLLGLPL